MAVEVADESERKKLGYRLTAVLSIHGLLPTIPDQVLIEGDGFSVRLVTDPDPYLQDADRSNAVAHLMLRGLFGGPTPEGTPAERVAAFVMEAREARERRFGKGPFLVVTVDGTTQVAPPRVSREEDDFVVWIDGGNRAEILETHSAAINAVISALVIYDDRVGGIAKVVESVTYFRDDGKPIYARSITMGGATAYVSSPVPPDVAQSVRAVYDAVTENTDLDSPWRLLRRAYEAESDDRFQAFWSAWLALEMFINKTFASYETRLLGMNGAGAETRASSRYWTRIRAVMKDKYGLADKFAAIALILDPQSADADLHTLETVKATRDAIAHRGENRQPKDLPLELTRNLARKYLRLHLGTGRTGSEA